MTTAAFNPSPTSQAQLLDDFSNPTLSLRDIAAAHKTTLTALSAYISRPDIQALLDIRKDVALGRVQLIALDHLPPAIAAASSVLAAFHSEESALKPDPTTLAKRADPAVDYRARRTALYSASLLFRLSRPIALHAPRHSSHRAREASSPHASPEVAPTPRPQAAPTLDLATLEQLVSQLEALQHDDPDTQPPTEPTAHPAAAPSPELPDSNSALETSDLKSGISTPIPAPAFLPPPPPLPLVRFQISDLKFQSPPPPQPPFPLPLPPLQFQISDLEIPTSPHIPQAPRLPPHCPRRPRPRPLGPWVPRLSETGAGPTRARHPRHTLQRASLNSDMRARTRIYLSLLFGALTTVAVAWVCAMLPAAPVTTGTTMNINQLGALPGLAS